MKMLETLETLGPLAFAAKNIILIGALIFALIYSIKTRKNNTAAGYIFRAVLCGLIAFQEFSIAVHALQLEYTISSLVFFSIAFILYIITGYYFIKAISMK